jgi:hypothetical protein
MNLELRTDLLCASAAKMRIYPVKLGLAMCFVKGTFSGLEQGHGSQLSWHMFNWGDWV